MKQGVSKEQIARAKAVDILEYLLANEPDNLKRIGNSHYLKDHDSFEISNGLWNWHSRGVGGKNVIDYLIKVRGYGFVDAVRVLANDETPIPCPVLAKARPPTELKQFTLPPRNRDNERIIAHLQSRGIDKTLVQECINRGQIYESATYHHCVFVGRDENNKAKFAALRSVSGDFKRDATGSDKRYGFAIPPANKDCKTVAVFESPIDALSHKILYPEMDIYRLSLGGVALSALTHFLQHHKEIRHCKVCTDNDAAGESAVTKIAEIPGITAVRELPMLGKDWNEFLQIALKEVNQMEDKRKDIRFINSDYKELFRIKDGESIKITRFDGEEFVNECRWIDETHTRIGSEHYHICEFAEIMEKNGNTCERIENQKAKLIVLAAKYGETLQEVEIPMTKSVIERLVGGKYEAETLYYPNRTGQIKDEKNEIKGKAFGVLVRGKSGIAAFGMTDGVLTNLHPYNAQNLKRELVKVEANPPEKAGLLDKIEKCKAKSAEQNTNTANPDKSRDSTEI
ncbi:hypothetical protein FACS189499_04120 [Clostridia bacterium]|nr:hypothetical protein FACS189499_04120 [Clostridia bacterium]